ncbi:MAG TPA: EpsI family protein [Bryobacteraceae bacterium]|nr:EpsI family protein [Bryobacteraceae bacterium]
MRDLRIVRAALGGWMLPAILVFAAQAAVIYKLSVPERELPVPALTDLSSQFGPWRAGGDQTLEKDVLDFLRPDAYISRDYVNVNGDEPINVFVAYFKSLQNTYGPHSPRNCLPGAGWNIVSTAVKNMTVTGEPQGIPVNQFVLEKGGERILAIYWYQNDRRAWAEEFQAKLTMLPDLIRYRRSDASIVRLIVPLGEKDPDRQTAYCQKFVNLMFPSLSAQFKLAD